MVDALREGAAWWPGCGTSRSQEAARRGTAELVAICDPVTTVLDGDHRDWRAGVGHQEVLARDDIDVVTIATPIRRTSRIAVEALQAGKHVLCEKPLGLSRRRRNGRGGPCRRPCELRELSLPLGAIGAIPERADRDRRSRRGAAGLHELLQRGGAGPHNADPVAATSAPRLVASWPTSDRT